MAPFSSLRVPTPAIVLAAAAVAQQLVPGLSRPDDHGVEVVVTVALVLILFEGGQGIGLTRLRSVGQTIVTVGVVGTFLTAAGVALFLHLVVHLDWYPAVLVATAVAPTDPAVVFSVLGQHDVEGDSGTVLEGESGANDPVGIALMAGLLGAGGVSGDAFGRVAGGFALQMSVGLAVGVLAGWVVLRFPILRPLGLVVAGAGFGAAVLLHGSGFLAVFVLGVLLGDGRRWPRRAADRMHSRLASLGEVVAFVALGLTVHLPTLARSDVWIPGLAVGVVLALVVRPVLVGPLLLGSGLARRERWFVLLAGLKGAVPILLGLLALGAGVDDPEQLYGIVVVVVLFSVVVQGSLVPTLTQRLAVGSPRLGD